MNNEIKCCTQPTNTLDKSFWDNQWQAQQTGWDIGFASPAIVKYINTLTCKNKSILIAGCGNAYEAEYLLEKGHKNVTLIDIAPTLVSQLIHKYEQYVGNELTLIAGDFFKHTGKYDIIIEQTFFCAIEPQLRTKYRDKMFDLLKDNGTLVGLLFDRSFEQSPPFGGTKEEYYALFQEKFLIHKMEICTNSIPQRAGTELWIELLKK